MKLTLFPIAALVASAHVFAAEPDFYPLFNGKDLAGWTGEGYTVEDGAIVCTPAGRNLVTDGTFANYILEFEFKLPPGGNNGLGIHYPGNGDGAYTGMELQILDHTDPMYYDPGHSNYYELKETQRHGSLYGLVPSQKEVPLKPVGEWNKQRVSVMGSAIKVELNDTIILRANLDDVSKAHLNHEGVKRRSGHLAFLGHGDRVAFRNIRIAETAPAANEAGVTAAGFTKIFDGTTLKGWKHEPDTTNWFTNNGILKHNGKRGPTNDLWSEKEYQDFTLVFDWRWAGSGPRMERPLVQPDGSEKGSEEIEEFDSGIYMRGDSKSQVNLWNWNVGSGEVYGYRTDRNQPAAVRAGVTPREKADAPVGSWNRTMITLQGDRLTVTLNGKVVIQNAQLPGIPARGPIGFQHHGSAIDFANVWIKEL